MLDQELKSQLGRHLENLRRPIQITATLDGGADSATMRELLDDIAAVSKRIDVVVSEGDGEVRRPSIAVHPPGEEARVRFAGLPLGHELTSLVLALLHVSGHPPRVSAEALAQVERLAGPLHFETYFSRSCQNCPEVVQALNLMAARNPHVTHVAIDGACFATEVEQRQVMAVPIVYLNGQPLGQGRMELEEILAKIDAGAAARRARELDGKTFDMLVVGGGPAGAAAGIYAARKGIRTGVIADRLGGQVLDTLGIENFISVTETQGPKLVAELEAHLGAYPIEVMKHQRARSLTPGDLIGVELESGARLSARSVIVATGARWRDMNVPGETEYRTRGVTYCPHCDGPLFKGKRVAVIGGGNSGVEAAIDLAGVVEHVTLLEFLDALKADDILQRKLRSLRNADVILDARTTEVVGDGRQVTGLRYENRASGEIRSLAVSGIFVQIGLLPNTDWLKGTVELTETGEIVVDERGRTNIPGVFDYLIRSSVPAAA